MSHDAVPYEAVTPPPNGNKPLRRLSALDNLFEATGEVTIRCGTRTLRLEIQSVDLEFVESLCRPLRPEVPAIRELQSGKTVRIQDFANPHYQDALAVYNRTFSYVFVLCALRADIYDKQNRLVWSIDNSTHEIDAAKQALRDMGIVDSQLAIILDAVRALTQDVETRQIAD